MDVLSGFLTITLKLSHEILHGNVVFYNFEMKHAVSWNNILETTDAKFVFMMELNFISVLKV
jgi:hypothetical protein